MLEHATRSSLMLYMLQFLRLYSEGKNKFSFLGTF